MEVIGGTGPYTYSIGNNEGFIAVGQTFSNLRAAVYSPLLQDATGAQFLTENITVFEPTELRVTGITTTPVTCNGGADGTLTLEENQVMGGTPPYTYSIGTKDGFIKVGEELFINLEADIYMLTVRDANGCELLTLGVLVKEPTEVEIVGVTTTPATCPDFNDGTLTIEAESNATLEYSINGSLFQRSPIFTGLAPGFYDITVRQIEEFSGACAIGFAEVGKKLLSLTDNDVRNFILRKYCKGCLPDSCCTG